MNQTAFASQAKPVIAVIGTVGVPAKYGGFETLAENLVRFHTRMRHSSTLTVWCSGVDYLKHPKYFKNANLRYVNMRANGAQSILYDLICLLQAVGSGHDRLLLLGVSGALTLPIVRIISRARIITNIDGLEWKREKWSCIVRGILRASEWAAIRFSHDVIADNQAIADYVLERYSRHCHVIPYGGDHALSQSSCLDHLPENLPDSYALALCRIEPENNVRMILEAWENLDRPLVFVGNWRNTSFGRMLKKRYGNCRNLFLLDAIYDPRALRALRDRATLYLHGHSAGGTNPSLVEMMHFGIPIFTHGCSYNRHTTENKALYFETSKDLIRLAESLTEQEACEIGHSMREIATCQYNWDQIGAQYFKLLER